MTTIWLGILAYVLVQIGIGVWASRRIQTEGDYLLAGRSLGLMLASISLFATWFGAETVMGSSAAVAEQGLAGSRADPFGYALCLGLMAVLLAYQLRRRGYVTLGDFFRDRYSVAVEKIAVLILIPAAMIWAAAQLLAFGQILHVVTAIGIDEALVAATLLVILYTTLGGLLGDVVTDAVQAFILVAGLLILLGFVIAAHGGVGPAVAAVEPRQLSFVALGETLLQRADVWLIPVLGSLVSQEAMARLLATRSAEIARRACFTAAAIYLAVGLVPVAIALTGAHLAPDLAHRDEFLPALALDILPPVAAAVLIGALLSAILSTVDSTLLTVSSLASHNIIVPAVPGLSERGKVRSARSVVVLAGLAAYVIATGGETIFDLVQQASSFGTAGVLVTVLIGLWTRRGGAATALVTLALGLAAVPFGERVLGLDAPFIFAVTVAFAAFLVAAAVERMLGTPSRRPEKAGFSDET